MRRDGFRDARPSRDERPEVDTSPYFDGIPAPFEVIFGMNPVREALLGF